MPPASLPSMTRSTRSLNLTCAQAPRQSWPRLMMPGLPRRLLLPWLMPVLAVMAAGSPLQAQTGNEPGLTKNKPKRAFATSAAAAAAAEAAAETAAEARAEVMTDAQGVAKAETKAEARTEAPTGSVTRTEAEIEATERAHSIEAVMYARKIENMLDGLAYHFPELAEESHAMWQLWARSSLARGAAALRQRLENLEGVDREQLQQATSVPEDLIRTRPPELATLITARDYLEQVKRAAMGDVQPAHVRTYLLAECPLYAAHPEHEISDGYLEQSVITVDGMEATLDWPMSWRKTISDPPSPADQRSSTAGGRGGVTALFTAATKPLPPGTQPGENELTEELTETRCREIVQQGGAEYLGRKQVTIGGRPAVVITYKQDALGASLLTHMVNLSHRHRWIAFYFHLQARQNDPEDAAVRLRRAEPLFLALAESLRFRQPVEKKTAAGEGPSGGAGTGVSAGGDEAKLASPRGGAAAETTAATAATETKANSRTKSKFELDEEAQERAEQIEAVVYARQIQSMLTALSSYFPELAEEAHHTWQTWAISPLARGAGTLRRRLENKGGVDREQLERAIDLPEYSKRVRPPELATAASARDYLQHVKRAARGDVQPKHVRQQLLSHCRLYSVHPEHEIRDGYVERSTFTLDGLEATLDWPMSWRSMRADFPSREEMRSSYVRGRSTVIGWLEARTASMSPGIQLREHEFIEEFSEEEGRKMARVGGMEYVGRRELTIDGRPAVFLTFRREHTYATRLMHRVMISHHHRWAAFTYELQALRNPADDIAAKLKQEEPLFLALADTLRFRQPAEKKPAAGEGPSGGAGTGVSAGGDKAKLVRPPGESSAPASPASPSAGAETHARPKPKPATVTKQELKGKGDPFQPHIFTQSEFGISVRLPQNSHETRTEDEKGVVLEWLSFTLTPFVQYNVTLESLQEHLQAHAGGKTAWEYPALESRAVGEVATTEKYDLFRPASIKTTRTHWQGRQAVKYEIDTQGSHTRGLCIADKGRIIHLRVADFDSAESGDKRMERMLRDFSLSTRE